MPDERGSAGEVLPPPRCRVTGVVEVDLTGIAPGRAVRRLDSLRRLPEGVRVVLHVGPLVPDVAACHLIQAEGRRLNFEIWGEDYVVPRWLNALRGDPFEAEGVLLSGVFGA